MSFFCYWFDLILMTLLQELPNLEDLLFVGNPLYDACELEVWRSEAARRLPGLKKLDGETVLREDEPPLTVADLEVILNFVGIVRPIYLCL